MNIEPTASYDWNWAEQAEAEAQRRETLAAATRSCPSLTFFLLARHHPFQPNGAPFQPDDAERLFTQLRTPAGIPDLPPGLGFVACCLLNPDATSGVEWAQWAFGTVGDAGMRRAILDALAEIGRSIGPLNVVCPDTLEHALAIASPANNEQDSRNSQESQESQMLIDAALVRLFQPADAMLHVNDDTQFAPTCERLLAAGASPSARDPEGNSPLSGINFLLTEAEVSMADPRSLQDILNCVQMLLDAGAPPSSVRPMPALALMVQNQALRSMLVSRQERDALACSLAPQDAAVSRPPAAEPPRTNGRL